MTFSPILALAAAAVATVALLALQRLRPQPTRRVVATTQFWSAAIRTQQQRSLWGRLGRWGSFAAVLAGLLLLAGALSGWTRTPAAEPMVFVVDTGYTMTASHDGRSRLAEATAALDAQLATFGGTAVTVITAGDRPRVLDAAGRPAALLRPLIETIRATTEPAATAAALRTAADLLPSKRGRVVWYTDRTALPPGLPAELAARVETRTVGVSAVNSAVTSAVFMADAESPTRGTLRVTTTTWGTPRPALHVRFSGTNVATAEVPVDADGVATLVDLTADGRTVEVDLIGDSTGVDADDHATVHLPNHMPVRFVSRVALDPPLRTALESFGSIAAGGPADIRIIDDAAAGELDALPAADWLPVLHIVRSGGPIVPGTSVVPEPGITDVAGLKFEHAVSGPGFDAMAAGATPLLRAGSSVLAAVTRDERPTLRLSAALWTAPSTVPKRPAFVVFLEQACRSLAGHQNAATISTPAADGDLRLDDARPALPEPPAAAAGCQPWEWLLMLGAAAMAVEGVLYATRKII